VYVSAVYLQFERRKIWSEDLEKSGKCVRSFSLDSSRLPRLSQERFLPDSGVSVKQRGHGGIDVSKDRESKDQPARDFELVGDAVETFQDPVVTL